MVDEAVDSWAEKVMLDVGVAASYVRIRFNAMAGGYESRAEYIAEKLHYHNWHNPEFDRSEFVKGLVASDIDMLTKIPFNQNKLDESGKMALCNQQFSVKNFLF